ncbi:hypothetical protein H6G54_05215 [Anabaena cylindrica FACHB-243]|uniref:Uncharacterized protein n=1 Tax=Anabaena cylindrica (strain ATCC 27899 / PCC 7122) TaxID=272123 RepID=K9ZPU8_ANACC|nr:MULTISPECIES: hypothetical protein [Anabaena]AFZ60819.1 hypothetical protein Anacy_5507 [Anabaena cylindrica PCC 7122]MBD2417119.1 hypothetical protein [Anabaena cylindrica FACHB-243]MBY5280815.1 hypothetical protein [Anabaena sp. CCAP 1446/1C]MBY5307091.1 hypothetical protein [Anabaena sp. CCAP 1446/1C]MCM2406820.1 hypothetical protein [Anabaena sp. CCAP 1446/1C]
MQKQIIISKLEKYYLATDPKNLLEAAKDYLSQGLVNAGKSYIENIKTVACFELSDNRLAFNFELEKKSDRYSVVLASSGDIISIKKGESSGTLLFSGTGLNLSTGYCSCYSDIHKAKKYLIKYCQDNDLDYSGLGTQVDKILYLEGNDHIKSAVVFKFRFNLAGFEDYTIFIDSVPYAIRNDYRIGHIQSVLDGSGRYSVMDSLV